MKRRTKLLADHLNQGLELELAFEKVQSYLPTFGTKDGISTVDVNLTV